MILPVDEAQFVGLDVNVPVIIGLGLTMTFAVAVALHPVDVIVPVTV